MAEQSTTNLISAVNKVLENLGERRQGSLASPVARKCAEALGDTVLDIASVHDWEWAKESIPAISWTLDTADLGDIQRLHGVAVGDTAIGFRFLPFMDNQSYDTHPITAYTGTEDSASYYTIYSYNKIKVNPYPSESISQSRFRFYITQSFTKPVLPTDFFPVPERVMPLVYYRAMHMMALNHLDDPGAAAQFANQYEALAQRLRDRERSVPSGGLNTFKMRTRKRGW